MLKHIPSAVDLQGMSPTAVRVLYSNQVVKGSFCCCRFLHSWSGTILFDVFACNYSSDERESWVRRQWILCNIYIYIYYKTLDLFCLVFYNRNIMMVLSDQLGRNTFICSTFHCYVCFNKETRWNAVSPVFNERLQCFGIWHRKRVQCLIIVFYCPIECTGGAWLCSP